MGFDLEWVRERVPGRRVEWFDSVDSTMTVAARMAREGCASGSLAVADAQTAGIGRHGHSWHSEAGAGLYVSIVLRVPVDAAGLPVLMVALGLAAQEAMVKTAGLEADLRWPNDVLINGKKCAGILAQIESDAVIAGIGINVNHTTFPKEIEPLATSLRLAGARKISREELLVALAEEIGEYLRVLADEGAEAILRLFANASSYAEGRRVRVEQDGSVIEGMTCGLDHAGFLRVRLDDGKETKIVTGGVRPA